MDRRTFLSGSAAAGVTTLAGCLGVLGGGSPGATSNVVLSKPEKYDKLRESRDAGHLAYPIHGDEIPEMSLPAALGDRTVSTRGFVGERHVVTTFIYTRCYGPCQRLTGTLAQVQDEALTAGYASELAFLPTTFDPAYDTPARLREFGRNRGAVVSSDSWVFLRPRNEQRVDTTVQEKFGIFIDRLGDGQPDNGTQSRQQSRTAESTVTPLHGDEDHGGNDSTGNESTDKLFNHLSMVVLANKDGYVERTYTGSRLPGGGGLLDDVETLRDRW